MIPKPFPYSVVFISLLAGIVFIFSVFFFKDEQDFLRANGIQADAEVLSIQDAGNRHDKNPKIILKLKVLPANAPSFDAEVITPITEVHIPDLEPGKKLKVRYDANDKMKVLIDESENMRK